MFCLLQGKLEPWRWLTVRPNTQVFDAVPRDVVEPQEVHNLFIHAERLKNVQTDPARHQGGGAAVEA